MQEFLSGSIIYIPHNIKDFFSGSGYLVNNGKVGIITVNPDKIRIKIIKNVTRDDIYTSEMIYIQDTMIVKNRIKKRSNPVEECYQV